MIINQVILDLFLCRFITHFLGWWSGFLEHIRNYSLRWKSWLNLWTWRFENTRGILTPAHREITSTASSQRWERWAFVWVWCILSCILPRIKNDGGKVCVFDRKKMKSLVLTWKIYLLAQWICLWLELKRPQRPYNGDCCTWSTTLTYKVCTAVAPAGCYLWQ